MYPIEEFRGCVRRIADILAGLGVRFHLTGGAAAIAWGDPRTTQDIDLVVDRAQLHSVLPRFLEAIERERFLNDVSAIRQAVESGRQFQLLDLDLTLKLDFYPRELVPGELDRSVVVEVFPSMPLPVVSRADAAVSKLIWIDRGSHKSRRDLREVMHRATADEAARVRDAAVALGLSALLDAVLSEPNEASS